MILGLLTASADEITLNDGTSKISGKLLTMASSGTIELAAPAAENPLLIKGDNVQKIVLSEPEKNETLPPTMVQLINGDNIRGTVEEMDQKIMILNTDEAGIIKIDRSHIASTQFGLSRANVIYSGPNDMAEWKQQRSTRDRWLYRKGSLITTGRSTASKDLKLPNKFTLSFKLKWRSERPPQYEVFFADPLGNSKLRPDRYSFSFSNYSTEIRRHTANPSKHKTIAHLSRDSKLYKNNEMLVELRVDRETGQIQLFINDEPEGDFVDPIENIPEGTGIRIVSQSMRGSQLEISNIKVTELNGNGLRHLSEGHLDDGADSLILDDDERWSGKLVGIKKSNDGSIFHFESPSRETTLEVPISEVSMIYLSHLTGDEDPKTKGEVFHAPSNYIVNLANDWAIKTSSCQMDDQTLSAKHPLLGALQIQRSRIASINHIEVEEKSAPDK